MKMEISELQRGGKEPFYLITMPKMAKSIKGSITRNRIECLSVYVVGMNNANLILMSLLHLRLNGSLVTITQCPIVTNLSKFYYVNALLNKSLFWYCIKYVLKENIVTKVIVYLIYLIKDTVLRKIN